MQSVANAPGLVIVDGIDVPHALEEVQPDTVVDAPQDDCMRTDSVNYIKNALLDSNASPCLCAILL